MDTGVLGQFALAKHVAGGTQMINQGDDWRVTCGPVLGGRGVASPDCGRDNAEVL